MLFCWICLVCYSGNSIQSEAEWLISVGSAGPYSCLPTYEDAQENSGPPVICVLCHLRPHRSSHLHSKTSGFMTFFFLQCFWMCLPFLKYNEYEKYFEIYKSNVWMNHRTEMCRFLEHIYGHSCCVPFLGCCLSIVFWSVLLHQVMEF